MRLKATLTRLFTRTLGKTSAAARLHDERPVLLQAQLAAWAVRARDHVTKLSDIEFRAFSQWGEDGIIDWLAENLPGIPHVFVEFGVEDYRESNTRLLLQMRNWRGLVLDGSSENVADIRRQPISWRHDLTARQVFLHRDNINEAIQCAGFEGPIGLLSIDVDGNDYWLWQAINVVNPAIVICEYNAVLGDMAALTVPYAANFHRSAAHFSNLYFGASIKALATLAEQKGYSLIGTSSAGCNAFFVRNDLAPAVLQKLEGAWIYPSLFREGRDSEGKLSLVGGPARAEVIADLPLFDVARNIETTISGCGEIYSSAWAMGRAVQWNDSVRMSSC